MRWNSPPQSHGGTDDENNLALACRSCNGFKAARLQGIDPTTGQKTPLLHPRRDQWAEHFGVNVVTLEIHGLTVMGRATAETLRFNSLEQLRARLQWRRLDLFP